MTDPISVEIHSEEWRARERAEETRLALRFAVFLVAGLALAGLVSMLKGYRGLTQLAFIVFGALVVATILFGMSHWFPALAASSFLSFLAPNRGSAPRETSYSHIQAMSARGDVDGALRAFEEIIAADPAAVDARLRAAELYATSGRDVPRAAALFVDVRRVPGLSAERDLYASQRLIDLYDGALRQPQRSLTELRRIIERHPGTREAEFARVALSRRRAEQGNSGQAPA